ncbi:MAG: QueT transporter family protein [Ruminococcus sp.]|nr:QueT transporter family protein [Ruminococcus sp.]
MEIFSARRVTTVGVVTALYVALTLMCSNFAYGQIQFRVSEMLMLLCFYNKDYIVSMTLGCFLANIFSSLGAVDLLFGTAATVIAAVLMYLCRKKTNLLVSSLFPVVSNALIVGAELKLVLGLPFWVNAAYVALGELVCVTILGVIVFKLLEKNKAFMKIITEGRSIYN